MTSTLVQIGQCRFRIVGEQIPTVMIMNQEQPRPATEIGVRHFNCREHIHHHVFQQDFLHRAPAGSIRTISDYLDVSCRPVFVRIHFAHEFFCQMETRDGNGPVRWNRGLPSYCFWLIP